uniref:G-protein coupled receptors family 2 profile 2 domain-containing protein n=1 Tax=Naja naja TaxID=35670 RepID=A0A8C7E5B9_NAJNA
MNLFLSHVLRAAAILLRDSLLWLHFPRDLEVDLSGLPRDQAVTGCRLAQILTQYCVCANYFWLLVEGLYLHNLLGPMAFMGESYLPAYLLLGWGESLPWCWERNDNLGYWWIIRCPILVSILVNFMIFIRVLKIVNSKLRAQQIHYTDYKCRLARSTLTLIPLLGTHGVAFALVTEEQALGTLRYVKFFFELFFNSFQVRWQFGKRANHFPALLLSCPLSQLLLPSGSSAHTGTGNRLPLFLGLTAARLRRQHPALNSICISYIIINTL